VLPVSALPSKETRKVVEILKRAYPQVVYARSVMEVNLNNPNFTSHPPVMILNASRIEATKGDFDIYKEGFDQTSVKKVTAALEQERLKVCEAFDIKED
jgi:opine dehydrogenase